MILELKAANPPRFYHRFTPLPQTVIYLCISSVMKNIVLDGGA